MSVRAKLMASFGTVVGLMILIVVFAWLRLEGVGQAMQHTTTRLTPQMMRISDLRTDLLRVSLETRNAMLVKTPQDVAATLAIISELRGAIGESLKRFEAQLDSDQARTLFAAIRSKEAEFWQAVEAIAPLISAGERDRAFEMLTARVVPARNALLAAMVEQRQYQDQALQAAGKDAIDQAVTAERLLFILAAAALVLSAVLVYLITRGLARQLGGEPGYATDLAQRVAAGDLSSAVAVRAGDTTSLVATMGRMQAELAAVVSQVRSSADSVATASQEIADGNMDLSARTEQQASSLQQTVGSIEQLTGAVRQNADNAAQGNQLAQTASSVAVRGGQVVEQVVGTMQDINDSSKKIADIIGVIDGIAFQTNILALNAAVEAARAGEQGRGFAVVAAEVRTLAQRSADAARQIKELISASVGRVEAGTALVGEAGSTMREIVSSIQRVADIMGEISAASAEQSAGIDQVNGTVMQMDQVTQQNAALVEQASAAAASLREQAGQLVSAVSVFRVGASPAA